MSILQEKLQKYEGSESTKPAYYDSPTKLENVVKSNNTANYKLDTDQKEKVTS